MGDLTRIETIVFLQNVDFFSACSAQQIFSISAIARQRRYEEGERICRANEPADALYSVVRGRVQLENLKGDGRTVTPLGTFGIMEILSGRLHAYNATAATDSLVLMIDSEDFFDLLANNIEIVKALFRQMLDGR